MTGILTKIGIAIIALALADLIYLNYWVISSQKSSGENAGREADSLVEQIKNSPSPSPSFAASPSPASKSETSSSPTTIVEKETVVEKETQTIVQTSQKEIFIPIGSGSTNSNSYTDLAGLKVTIDTNKYSSIESVVFEGSIWVQDGNGKMYAQLFNESDGHPVWNSEISTSSAGGVLTTSSEVTLDSGNKTYKVQAKTNLTAYKAHVDNARIKITLK
jgi:hypothetical protein